MIPSPDGVVNPWNPSQTVGHWQCADIKVDAQQTPSGVTPFFQVTPPIDHTQFDQLTDNSPALPPGDMAWLHMQVHNRSNTSASNVWVWALYAHFSAGLPALDATFSNAPFDFWGQFEPGGTINSTLTPDNKWQPVGAPIALNNLDAAHPGVASWPWTVPTLMAGDSGHYCVVAFIHAAGALLGPMSTDVDEITPNNKQIGQKNLQIIGGVEGGMMIQFHNPTIRERIADLTFDLRALPKQVQVAVHLDDVRTARPLEDSISGFDPVRDKEHMHTIAPLAEAKVRSVVLAPRGSASARIRVRLTGVLPPGTEWPFDIRRATVCHPGIRFVPTCGSPNTDKGRSRKAAKTCSDFCRRGSPVQGARAEGLDDRAGLSAAPPLYRSCARIEAAPIE
jgi:hypothetical protein